MIDLVQTLMEMRNGKVASDLNRKMAELMDAVFEHRKKGSITIKIDVTPKKFDEAMLVTEVDLAPEVKLSKPERPLDSSLFFVTKDGSLSRTDPAQHQMFEVEEPNARTNQQTNQH